MIEGVELAPLLLAELTEVAKGNVALLADVEVLENGVHLVDLIFDPQVVETFLELIEADPVVKVHIEVSVRLGDALESLIDFDPEEVEHLLEHAALVLGDGGVTSIDVGAQDEIDILALILLDGFLHREVKV